MSNSTVINGRPRITRRKAWRILVHGAAVPPLSLGKRLRNTSQSQPPFFPPSVVVVRFGGFLSSVRLSGAGVCPVLVFPRVCASVFCLVAVVPAFSPHSALARSRGMLRGFKRAGGSCIIMLGRIWNNAQRVGLTTSATGVSRTTPPTYHQTRNR